MADVNSLISENSGSSVSCQEDSEVRCQPRVKRRKVAEPERKRVAKACVNCRRLKEKCDGCSPCGRCVRYRRECLTTEIPVPEVSTSATNTGEELSERLAYLESIAKHFLGDVPKDREGLKQVVEDLKSREARYARKTLSEDESRPGNDTTTPCSARTRAQSDPAFTSWLQDEVHKQLTQAKLPIGWKPSLEPPNSAFLPLASSVHTESLPPKAVTMFLSSVYLDFAQTTTLLVEQQWVDDKIERLYSTSEPLSPQHHPWLCSMLIILAIGVRYAHMAKAVVHDTTDLSQASMDLQFDRDTSTRFHRMATNLVPDVLLLPCVDSVQALMLLAHVSLMWNEIRQAYTYLGAASRIAAILNNPDLTLPLDTRRTSERLYRLAFAWDRRIRILHGIPSSTSDHVMELEQPQLYPADTTQQQISLEASTMLFVQLTNWLATMARPKSKVQYEQGVLGHPLSHLVEIRTEYKKWWSSLDISRIPILQLNRRTAPLHICYHVNLIFVGRSFAFHQVKSQPSIEAHNTLAELVDDAEYSAYEIIDICAMLDKSNGLDGLKYISFSACCAAVCMMLAQSLIGRCHLFRGKLQEGLNLVRKMARGEPMFDAGLSAIDAINDGIETLAPHKRGQKYQLRSRSPLDAVHAYRTFQDWARIDSQRTDAHTNFGVSVRGDDDEAGDLQDVFGRNILDPSWFDFDLSVLNGSDESIGVY